MNNLDNNIVDEDNFNSRTFLITVGFSVGIYLLGQLLYWCIYLRHFKIKSLDVNTGKRIQFSSLFKLWSNCLSLVRYYWGMSRSNTAGRFTQANSEKCARSKTPGEALFEFESTEEGIHAPHNDLTCSYIETSTQNKSSTTQEQVSDPQVTRLIADKKRRFGGKKQHRICSGGV